jgi:hypothetical protein
MMGTLPDQLFPRCAGLDWQFNASANSSTTAGAVIPLHAK